MKRSELITKLNIFYADNHDNEYYPSFVEDLLDELEFLGVAPPGVPAIKIRGKDHRWGGGCTIRCICSECTPEFIMHEWEKE